MRADDLTHVIPCNLFVSHEFSLFAAWCLAAISIKIPFVQGHPLCDCNWYTDCLTLFSHTYILCGEVFHSPVWSFLPFILIIIIKVRPPTPLPKSPPMHKWLTRNCHFALPISLSILFCSFGIVNKSFSSSL